MTITPMIMGILLGKAVDIFDADCYNISGKKSITKDGITISTTEMFCEMSFRYYLLAI